LIDSSRNEAKRRDRGGGASDWREEEEGFGGSGKISFQISDEMPITFAEMGRHMTFPLRQWPRLFRVFNPVSKKWKGSTTSSLITCGF